MATTADITPQPPAATPAAESFKRPLLVTLYVAFAWATGVMIAIVVFVGIPLQIWAHKPQVADVLGLFHGVFLYPEYVVLSIIVAFVYRLSIPHMALMALAGLIPGLSPFVAGRTVKHIAAKQAEKAQRQAERAARIAAKKERAAQKAAAAQGSSSDGQGSAGQSSAGQGSAGQVSASADTSASV